LAALAKAHFVPGGTKRIVCGFMAQATRGLFRAMEAAHVTVARANLEIIVQCGLPGSGRCALGLVPELEVA